ncbi:Thymidylate synthase [compost metagenome]
MGVPFNIASYALLTHMVAYQLGYQVGEFIWTGGDCHLYSNHAEQVQELLSREPMPLPRIEMAYPETLPLWEVPPKLILLHDYNPHLHIAAEVSV